ncbi:MAG: hypothetical protein NZM04_00280 [Methylacidiphilales bacterium]|nr:hypothetical protein [Candidatus Methylacidiphilales bacterium]
MSWFIEFIITNPPFASGVLIMLPIVIKLGYDSRKDKRWLVFHILAGIFILAMYLLFPPPHSILEAHYHSLPVWDCLVVVLGILGLIATRSGGRYKDNKRGKLVISALIVLFMVIYLILRLTIYNIEAYKHWKNKSGMSLSCFEWIV